MANLSKVNSPDLATTFTCTVLQATILLLGIINFYSILAFCQAANKSKEHPYVKNTLILIMYLFAPIAAVCIAFSWISWEEDWEAGWFFIWFPFLVVVIFFLVVFATKNDISHFIDVHRLARAKLPQQAPPRTFAVSPMKDEFAMPPPSFTSPPRHAIINVERPPVVPQTEERQAQAYLDDEDAIGGQF